MEAVTEQLLQLGLPGIVILGLALAYWRERQSHHATQQARVQDSREVMNMLLEHDRAWQQVVEQLRIVLEGITTRRKR